MAQLEQHAIVCTTPANSYPIFLLGFTGSSWAWRRMLGSIPYGTGRSITGHIRTLPFEPSSTFPSHELALGTPGRLSESRAMRPEVTLKCGKPTEMPICLGSRLPLQAQGPRFGRLLPEPKRAREGCWGEGGRGGHEIGDSVANLWH